MSYVIRLGNLEAVKLIGDHKLMTQELFKFDSDSIQTLIENSNLQVVKYILDHKFFKNNK